MLYLTHNIDKKQICSSEITVLEKYKIGEKSVGLADRIVLECENTGLEGKAFKLIFFRATFEYRKNEIDLIKCNVMFSNVATWKLAYRLQEKTLSVLNERIKILLPDSYFAINLSFGDYCLLVPADKLLDLTFLYSWDDIVPIDKNENSAWKTEYGVALRKRILDKFDLRYIFNYLPHFGFKTDIFERLLSADVDTFGKIEECSRIAGVLLHYFTDEAANACFYANGELKHLDSDMRRNLSIVYNKLKHGIDQFADQISVSSIFSDAEWSFSFFNKALLFTTFGRSFATGHCEDQICYNNFHGFIPLISEDTKTVDSYFVDEFGTSYKFAFLKIPYSLTVDWYSFFPALLHEFSHYIPTPNRKARNQTVLKLTFSSVINEPLQKILKSSANGQKISNQIVNNIINSYDYLYETTLTFKDNGESKKFHDSMFFLHQTLDLFETIDFAYIYSCAYRIDAISDEVMTILKDCQEMCVKTWKDCAQSYLITYMMALREIRSDIAMYMFLKPNINLEEYVLLLASEPTWASQDCVDTADSVFLRFGFMTRYIYAIEHNRNDFEAESFNFLWFSKMQNIFDHIVSDHTELTSRISHMREYVDMYIEISFDFDYDKNNHEYKRIGVSAFEKALYGTENGLFDDSIVDSWVKQFERIMGKTSLYDSLKKMYCDYKNAKDSRERVLLNHQARLIFRDLFIFFPNIDKE